MRATLLLADHAVVAEGKLYINGGGWSVTTGGAPSAIAVKLDVPWDRTNQRLQLRLRLVGQDGEPVVVSGQEGPQPVVIAAEAEVGRPPGLAHGADIDFPLAFQIGPLPLQPGQRYQWVLDIDGETREDWRLTFSTRPAPSTPTTYVVDP
ncbi:MAG TPA: hypothetical protein VFV89_18015 [Nocardioides sp.]|uniref:DUF6941 family protein n=1 Tax=Nocardioides sp. TaxID=35761 RepID=UPI002E3748E6|nr:hypothetical protein [Nocardioides sp.]HEX5089708.1 hypothetical protein [Nocardioides sp.]